MLCKTNSPTTIKTFSWARRKWGNLFWHIKNDIYFYMVGHLFWHIKKIYIFYIVLAYKKLYLFVCRRVNNL